MTFYLDYRSVHFLHYITLFNSRITCVTNASHKSGDKPIWRRVPLPQRQSRRQMPGTQEEWKLSQTRFHVSLHIRVMFRPVVLCLGVTTPNMSPDPVVLLS